MEDQAREMNMPFFQPELADLDIAKKRAQVMGYADGASIAKRLKYEEGAEDMEIETETSETAVGGKPPLPLIEVTADSVQPPLPEDSVDLTIVKTEPTDDDSEKKTPLQKAENVAQESSETSSTNGTTPLKSGPKPDGSVSLPRVNTSKRIDETTYRNWYIHTPLTSVGITYVMYTPPPVCRGDVDLKDLPKNPITDLDREPWKTASASWYDPLYGDLAVPTGTFDAIRTLLKETKRAKRKPML